MSGERGRRRATPRRRRWRALLVLVLVFGALGAGGLAATPLLARLQGPADFPGPGGTVVTVQISEGQTLAQIANTLKALGVVASVDSFTQAAAQNPASQTIQPGTYSLKSGLPAAEAIVALLDPANRVTKKVVIPEGRRADWVIAALSTGTGIPVADFEAALKDPAALDLPDYAGGNIEGFLFPATYEFPPDATATTVLKTMVDKFNDVADSIDLVNAAKARGFTAYQILVIASLLEVEGHPRDFDRVARVVYNRLSQGMLLQFDSTVNYGLGKTDVVLSDKQLRKKTPYNTYLNPGLPPTPIDNPGEAALKAALAPLDGDWLYFTTVNLATQETKFTASYQEFLTFKSEFQAYCKANPGAC